ncbi:MAG: hypothetical protein ACI350_01530 [Prevotella sp.]
MKASELTRQQIERAIKKIAQKFPATDDAVRFTDIHLRVSQDTGEMTAIDDDDQEITRCVIEEWIDNKDEDFYNKITETLRTELSAHRESIEEQCIMKPYSYVLENDERETVAELFLVDDDTVIIGGDLMKDLDEDLNAFFENLLKNQ